MAVVKVAPAVKPDNQPTKAACWYSCFRMLFQWKIDKGDSSKDPDKILSMLDRSPNLFPYDMYATEGIRVQDCREAARYLGLRCGGGPISGEALSDLLKTRGPLWIAGNWGSGSHVIVVTGYNDDNGQIRYVNPYNNVTLKDSSGGLDWLNQRTDVWINCEASVMYW